jgi:hypothetical protein
MCTRMHDVHVNVTLRFHTFCIYTAGFKILGPGPAGGLTGASVSGLGLVH